MSNEFEAMHYCSSLEIFGNYGFACTENLHLENVILLKN